MDKEVIKRKIAEAIEDDPEKADIKKAYLFGSYLHGTPKEESDIDILIEFNSTARVGFFRLAAIQRSLGRFTGKKIDILTRDSLSKFFKDEVLREAEVIYEK